MLQSFINLSIPQHLITCKKTNCYVDNLIKIKNDKMITRFVKEKNNSIISIMVKNTSLHILHKSDTDIDI